MPLKRANTLKGLLEEAVSIFRFNPFIYTEANQSINYQEIQEEWQVTADLIAKNIPSCIVGIWTSNKLDGITGIGACIYHSIPYVPIDTDLPISRISSIVRDSGMGAILVSKDLFKLFKAHFPVLKVIEAQNLMLVVFKNDDNFEVPKDLAYILYTSGSTGTPKGVMISHKNALGFIYWAAAEFGFDSSDVFAAISEFHFDLSVLDFFVCIKVGGRLVLLEKNEIQFPRSVSKVIEKNRISVLYATPTFYRSWMDFGKMEQFDLSSLRKILYAGEPFPVDSINQLITKFSKADIYNLYGPTETNVCMFHQLQKQVPYNSQVPIGKPTEHMMIKVLGEKEGELLVSGDSVFMGYWKDHQKTSMVKKIIDGKEWYKTGDIVCSLPNGHWVFRGRIDRMVKRRGYRIELDEIEAIILSSKDVREIAVVVLNAFSEKIKIVAFYTLYESGLQLKQEVLREAIKEFLPLYMMPDRFIQLDKIPYTSSLKPDYQALVKQLNEK